MISPLLSVLVPHFALENTLILRPFLVYLISGIPSHCIAKLPLFFKKSPSFDLTFDRKLFIL